VSLRGNAILRAADRVLGPPILRVLGLRPRHAWPAAVTRIAVLRTAAVGDTLLVSGILRDLRAAFPAADLVLVTGTENAEAGRLSVFGVARTISVPVENVAVAAATLRRERFDVLFDTGAWPRVDAVIAALSGARLRVGFCTEKQYRHYAYDVAVPHSAAVHEIENYRSLLRAVGIATGAMPHVQRESVGVTAEVRSGWPPLEKPYIVFHSRSGGFRSALRDWPGERWVRLATLLAPLASTFVLTGASHEASSAEQLARDIATAGVTALSVAGHGSLTQVGGLLCDSMGLVSTNTGTMHLAALLGVPTVALNGPTAEHRWGPIGPRAAAVNSTLPGCGYLNLGFEYDGHRTDCMLGIEPDAVARAFHQVIAA
jgi:heptosyltransferase-3